MNEIWEINGINRWEIYEGRSKLSLEQKKKNKRRKECIGVVVYKGSK